jgi:hypothetical protein
MPNLPTPLRAALGLAATAVDEARKLPETLPQAVTTVPLMAVSSAMQASLKVQQRIATLAARGDEVLSQLRGSSTEPPSWATFDDDAPAAGTDGTDDGAQPAKAAFDLIDYDHTGFAEGSEDDEGRGRWDAVGVGGTTPEAELTLELSFDELLLTGDLGGSEDESDVTATPPSEAGPTPPPPGLAEAVSAPDLLAAPAPEVTRARKTGGAKAGPAKAGPAKSGPAKTGPRKTAPAKSSAATSGLTEAGAVELSPAQAGPVKAGPSKAGPSKAGPVKAAPVKAGPSKAAPAKAAKRAGRKAPDHEPLEVAARKAKPSPVPNPATMAAEILQAHEAAADDE